MKLYPDGTVMVFDTKIGPPITVKDANGTREVRVVTFW